MKHHIHCTFQQFPDTRFCQLQDPIVNIVQEGVQRETSNTKTQVQSVKTYERDKFVWYNMQFFLSLY